MSYRALSIHDGYGRVHMNRFRICVKPPSDRNRVATIGRELFWKMANYLDPNTASVQLGDHAWNNHATLKFRGVARIRSFSVPVHVPPLPVVLVPVPAVVRDALAPDMHTDSVGVLVRHETGFTVQTLKREYEDDDDKAIRSAVWAAAQAGALALPAGLGRLSADMIAKLLGDLFVDANQHHFLAGRRGFRFDWGQHFGYPDDRVVFETVAIERFSTRVFANAVIGMGSVETLVRNVWVDTLNRFCAVNRLEVIRNEQPGPGWQRSGHVHCMQTDVADRVTDIVGNGHYPTMKDEHQQILEPR
jgi:hypothetical protein